MASQTGVDDGIIWSCGLSNVYQTPTSFNKTHFKSLPMDDEVGAVINKCIQCGTCIGSCFSGRVTALNTRRILMEHLAKGVPIENHDALWFCVTCYACQERCPRGIPVTEIILKARNELARRKGLPGRLKNAFSYLEKHSALVPGKDRNLEMRKELGLPVYHSQFDDEARKEVSEIVKRHLKEVIR